MPFLIDTDVAIHLRDGDPHVSSLVDQLNERPYISAMTRIELEGGVHARPEFAERRRRALQLLLRDLPVLDVTEQVARAYGQIVAQVGFSRRKISDRVIAATALAHDCTFATINSDDFRDVPGLALIDWSGSFSR